MDLIDKNREPTPFELRIFGLILAVFFGLIGWLALRRFGSTTAAGLIWGATLLIVVLYYALPSLRRAIYFGWMTAIYPLGWLVSHALLAIIYYALLTPIGLLARLLGHDPLQRAFNRNAETYWTPHTQETDTSRYFKQF